LNIQVPDASVSQKTKALPLVSSLSAILKIKTMFIPCDTSTDFKKFTNVLMYGKLYIRHHSYLCEQTSREISIAMIKMIKPYCIERMNGCGNYLLCKSPIIEGVI
jgi:hypothetical protein